MDFRDSYNIFVFIILLLLICLIKPLIMLVAILAVSVYIPCHFIKISSAWISLLIVFFYVIIIIWICVNAVE